jgi:hypothetical protein
MPGWRSTATCERAARLISLELDGELGKRERAVLARHLNRCPECARLKETTGTVTTILRLSPPEHPSRRVTIPQRLVAPHRRRPRILVSIVAMAVLASAVASLLSAPKRPAATEWSSIALAQRVRVVEAELVPPQTPPPLVDDLTRTPLPAQPFPACSLGCWPTANV